MSNLELYEKFRAVPQEAQKAIGGGRLKGMTDINPMWRLKVLTEQFGPCGIGWKYIVIKKWFETSSTGETAAFVDIELYFKYNGEWSEAIPGTGGSSFATIETSGKLYVSDECFKMALTDAISVACKALGIGADIYYQKDRTKYDQQQDSGDKPKQTADKPKQASTELIDEAKIAVITKKAGNRIDGLLEFYKLEKIELMTVKTFFEAMKMLDKPHEVKK